MFQREGCALGKLTIIFNYNFFGLKFDLLTYIKYFKEQFQEK